jgi:hypothetical protein
VKLPLVLVAFAGAAIAGWQHPIVARGQDDRHRAAPVSHGVYFAHFYTHMRRPKTHRRAEVAIQLRVSRDAAKLIAESYVSADVPCFKNGSVVWLWNLDKTGVPDAPGEVRLQVDGSFSTIARTRYARSNGIAAELRMTGVISGSRAVGWMRHRNFGWRAHGTGRVTCSTGLIRWRARLRRLG